MTTPTTSSDNISPTVTTLTTPFVTPTDCSRDWAYSSDKSDGSFVYEVTTGAQQAACRPKEWKDFVNLYPAVCPSGWVYHSITSRDQYVSKHGEFVSPIPGLIATCCPSGYSPYNSDHDYDKPAQYRYCASSVNPGQTTITAAPGSSVTGETATFSEGNVIFMADWTIGWAESDRSTLSPVPPTIAVSTNIILSWVPGGPVNETAPLPTDFYYKKAHHWTSLGYFIAIGIPLIAISICAGCWVLFFLYDKRKAKHSETIRDVDGQDADRKSHANTDNGVLN